jgi:hypothetical protein
MTTPNEAYELHEKAEYWQRLASQQQELATEVRLLANKQRELAESWGGAAGTEGPSGKDLTEEARRIEEGLRVLAAQMFGLERAALEGLERALADEAHALRSD